MQKRPPDRVRVTANETERVLRNGRNKMSARSMTAAGALAAALLSSPSGLIPTASAQISDDVVKIGVLTNMTGPAASATGQGSVTSAQMAVDDFGGKVLGKPISVIVGDHQDKPDIGAGMAGRWD